MNERIKNIAQKVIANFPASEQWIYSEFEVFCKYIVEECARNIQEYVDRRIPASEYPSRIKQDLLAPEPERELLCYVEREEGFYKVYKPARGQIVTQAFIFCSYCNEMIYHCSGPRHDAVCIKCFEDSDRRELYNHE